jgi:hypothetical protein
MSVPMTVSVIATLALKAPPGTSDYTMRSEVLDGKEVIVYTVGKTVLQYDGRCIDGLPRC